LTVTVTEASSGAPPCRSARAAIALGARNEKQD